MIAQVIRSTYLRPSAVWRRAFCLGGGALNLPSAIFEVGVRSTHAQKLTYMAVFKVCGLKKARFLELHGLF